MAGFLPLKKEEMTALGWTAPDFVLVTGDAYVDHPSFAHAILSRLLESKGYRVAILSQPDWRDPKSICLFGQPKLGFLVSSGNMDSMVNHYSVAKRRRDKDAYTPGGKTGFRPDYAVTVYSKLIKSAYPDSFVVVGGIEASLRRLAHYDYWSDSVKRSALLDSKADLLVYGMGEKSLLEIAEKLKNHTPLEELHSIRGTAFLTGSDSYFEDSIRLSSYEDVLKDKKKFAKSFYKQYQNTDPFTAKRLVEPYIKDNIFVVQNPPQMPLTTAEFDAIYDLPYTRKIHPSYEELGGIPAIEEVRFSIVSSRGCFGACSFCALTFHQGRIVQTRSHESILKEAQRIIAEPDFKGYIHDVGGPTANFYHPSCDKQLQCGTCSDRQCLAPEPCKNLNTDHSSYLDLLRKLRSLPGIKKVFIRSGIRFDYLLYDKDKSFLRELVEHHVSGQLKVAPEHVSDKVLSVMGKPPNSVFQSFLDQFDSLNRSLRKEQYVVPYLISSHPGSTLKEAIELAEYLNSIRYTPEQVQDFYPTPSTLSTAIYYSGYDPRTMTEVYTPKDPHEKAMQRALLQFRNPKNADLVREALQREGRYDLIGNGKKCLISQKNVPANKNINKTKRGKRK